MLLAEDNERGRRVRRQQERRKGSNLEENRDLDGAFLNKLQVGNSEFPVKISFVDHPLNSDFPLGKLEQNNIPEVSSSRWQH